MQLLQLAALLLIVFTMHPAAAVKMVMNRVSHVAQSPVYRHTAPGHTGSPAARPNSSKGRARSACCKTAGKPAQPYTLVSIRPAQPQTPPTPKATCIGYYVSGTLQLAPAHNEVKKNEDTLRRLRPVGSSPCFTRVLRRERAHRQLAPQPRRLMRQQVGLHITHHTRARVLR